MGVTKIYDDESGVLLGIVWPNADDEEWTVEDPVGNQTTKPDLTEAVDWLREQRAA